MSNNTTQAFGFGNVATGQVVQKKVEFLQRAGSVGRGDSRDGLNPDIRSDFRCCLYRVGSDI